MFIRIRKKASFSENKWGFHSWLTTRLKYGKPVMVRQAQ